MYRDPEHPKREILEVYDPPIRIMRTDGRNAKAIAYYKFRGSMGLLYYHLDVTEENGFPYSYIGGNWGANECALIEEPKCNKDAVNFLTKESWL